MAAEAIAGELDLELFKLNLGLCLSPLVGEFEERMERVLSEAARAPVVLMLDEFDALGARRGAVKEARDRYASLEAAYLLQRLEEHEGVIILATNLLKNVDEAFVRRITYVVEFELPTVAERLEIWRGSFPPAAPIDDGVDFDALAESFKITGGEIKNICLRAASLAAADGGRIVDRHILAAARRELKKLGRQDAARFSPSQRRELAPGSIAS
jgi:SpoVK/Ycf46/Vps4 family AAA+-type ATPase